MTTASLERAFAAGRSAVANVTPDQLSASTPCASWDVRALLNHLIGGSFYFAETMNTGKGPSDLPDVDLTGGDLVATFDDGIKQAVAAFGAPGATEKMVELPFGTMPGAVFMNIATTDAFVHAWDVAKATGQSTDIDPELAGQLLQGAQAFAVPEIRGDDGVMPFGPEQSAPAGASAADELAAFLGRTV